MGLYPGPLEVHISPSKLDPPHLEKQKLEMLKTEKKLNYFDQVHVDHGFLHPDVGAIPPTEQHSDRGRPYRNPQTVRRSLSSWTHVEHIRFGEVTKCYFLFDVGMDF